MVDSKDENYAVTPILSRVNFTPPHKKTTPPRKRTEMLNLFNTSSQDSRVTPTSLVANSSLCSSVLFLDSTSSASKLIKKQTSPCLSLPGSALPLKIPQQSYTYIILDHYEWPPNRKSNNIPPSATLPSPPPPDRKLYNQLIQESILITMKKIKYQIIPTFFHTNTYLPQLVMEILCYPTLLHQSF